MTDVAGLVLGVIATWNTCVQVFDIVDSSRNYGMDYELLRVKLEVERVRLLVWGEAVGLSGVGQGPDARFNRDDVCGTVLRLLGCIQHIFEHSARLEGTYGLSLAVPSASNQPNDDGRLVQQSLILGSVFKRAYESLRRSAEDRRRATPLAKKATWAIRDKKKFQDMVSEIKGFNDNLESLFPDMKRKTRDLISIDIGESEEVRDLRLVQEATEGEHEDISDTASMRLGVLRAVATTRSASSGGAQTVTGKDEASSGNPGEGVVELGAPSDDLSKEMKAVELYLGKKSEGALCLGLTGPYGYSDRVTSYVYWDGRQHDDRLALSFLDEGKGFVKMSHASFGRSTPQHDQGGARILG